MYEKPEFVITYSTTTTTLHLYVSSKSFCYLILSNNFLSITTKDHKLFYFLQRNLEICSISHFIQTAVYFRVLAFNINFGPTLIDLF